MIHHHDDLEQLQTCFDGWDVELIPLDPNRRAGWASIAVMPSARVIRMHAGRSVVIRGRAPPIDDCLMLSASHGTPLRWQGQPIDANRFALAGKGARFDVFLPGDATLCVVATQLLAAVPPRRIQLRTATPESIRALLRCAESAASDDARRDRNAVRQPTDTDLVRHIRTAMQTSTVASRATSMRTAAVARACRFIDSRLPKPISLADLCQHCGVGARTLEYGFREFYDTTPIGFVKSQRLTGTRGALMQAGPQRPSVSEIAGRWGFMHMGQYSADYRSLFGETPTMTVQRARGARAGPR